MPLGNPLPSPAFKVSVADVLPTTANPIAPPANPTAVPNVGGGTFGVGSYFYKITALNAAGESCASQEIGPIAVTLNGTISITAASVTGATSYRVYRGGAKDGEGFYQTVAGAVFGTFVDTGTVGTAGTPPVPTWQDVPLLNSWDADFQEQVSEYDVFLQADPIEVNGRAKVSMSMGGYQPDSTDSASAVINTHQTNKDFMMVRVLWDGTNGFFARARIQSNKNMAKAGATLIEVTYSLLILPSSLTQIGLGPTL